MTNDEFIARVLEAADHVFPVIPASILASFEAGKAHIADPANVPAITTAVKSDCDLIEYFNLYDGSPQEAEAFICGIFEHDFGRFLESSFEGGYSSGKGYVGQDYHAYACGLMTIEFQPRHEPTDARVMH